MKEYRYKKKFINKLKKEIDKNHDWGDKKIKPNVALVCYSEYGVTDDFDPMDSDHCDSRHVELEGTNKQKIDSILKEFEYLEEKGLLHEIICVSFYIIEEEDIEKEIEGEVWLAENIYFSRFRDRLNPQELKLTLECEKFIKDSKEAGKPRGFYHLREYVVESLE